MNSSDNFDKREKTVFFRRKWLKEHTALCLCSLLPAAAIFAEGLLSHKPLHCGIGIILIFVTYISLRNKMMSYIEGKLYAQPPAESVEKN